MSETVVIEDKAKQRIGYIDILKFFGIFLLFIDHTGNSIQFYGSYFSLRTWICSFHMPLFFIAYGLVVNQHKISNVREYSSFFHKRFCGIIIPFFIWAAIYAADFNWRFFTGLLYGSNRSLGFAGTNAVLWFLPTFFIAELLYQFAFDFYDGISKRIKAVFINKNKEIFRCSYFIIIDLLYCLISYNLAEIKNSLPVIKRFDYPCGFDVAFTGSAFMIAGYLLRKIVNYIHDIKNILKLLIFSTLILITFYISQFNVPSDYRNTIMAWGVYGKNYFLFFILACVSTVSLAVLSMFFEKIKILLYLGSNSIISMSAHYIIFIYTVYISKKIYTVLLSNSLNLSFDSIITALLNSVLTYICCIFIIWFINKFMPVFKGK